MILLGQPAGVDDCGRFYGIVEGDTSKVPLQKYSRCFCFRDFLGYSTDGMMIKIQ